MSASFDVVGRLQLAGYAGTASGILRSRIHPLVPIAAIDVLAVALALGAMNIVGTMVSGYRENPFITALDRVKDDVTAYPAIAIAPAVPKPVSTTLAALMLVPNAELLFAPPMIIGTPFEANTGDTVRFISPADVAASGGSSTNGSAEGEPSSTDIAVIEDPDPPLPTPNITDPPSPPVAKILGIAGVGQARALELAGRVTPPATNLVDEPLPLQSYSGESAKTIVSASADSVAGDVIATVAGTDPPASTNAAATVTATIAAPVQAVAAPVQQVAQSVTQPVTKVVSGVTGLLN